jgi:hypothetical protein
MTFDGTNYVSRHHPKASAATAPRLDRRTPAYDSFIAVNSGGRVPESGRQRQFATFACGRSVANLSRSTVSTRKRLEAPTQPSTVLPRAEDRSFTQKSAIDPLGP